MSDSENLVPGATASSIQLADSPLDLREFTSARIALDSTGASIAMRPALEFLLAHAQARDAVHSALAVPSLMAALRERELAAVSVRSAAADRTEYLRRPDLGRKLSGASGAALARAKPAAANLQSGTTLSLILADGLSALATERHALAVVDALLLLLGIGEPGCAWVLAQIVIAEQARVALGDEIGQALSADVTVLLIGERPGLSSPDSLGAYITWSPRPGRTDAERNCVSNIRTKGLDYASAAAKIAWYITEGRRLGLSGVKIREGSLPDTTKRYLCPPLLRRHITE
jgi:ethanolamine ammonia-lyase small subunit